MQQDDADNCLSRERFDAVILDLDGVITRTAKVHATAWKAMFDDFLGARAPDEATGRPFDIDRDYRRYVDGKPRQDGVRSFLESRGITLPEGGPDDPPHRETQWGLGNRKNRLFRDRLAEDGVEVFASSVALVRTLRDAGFRTAVVSSSRNCAAVLDAAGIAELFDARVDGVDLERQGLAGKPAPDMFIEASRRLGTEPGRAVGIEDAEAGVAAIRAAGFGLVVGVDRDDRSDALHEHGADIVVDDLGALRVAARDAVPSALEHLDDILPTDRRPAVFLDFDGTLTPIVSHPDDALLDEAMRAVLDRLRQLCPVAIVSGRDLPDVRDRVDLPGTWYAGSHGFDIAGPDGERGGYQEGSDYLPALDAAGSALHAALDAVEGCLVERKRFSIAVHYRQVPDASLDTVRQAVEQVHDAHAELRLSRGKKLYELQPDIDWDKGKALQWLMQRQGLAATDHVAIYIGDDVTDEDAFRALEADGVGIVVCPDPGCTHAAYRLDDPAAVRRFLERFADRLAGQQARQPVERRGDAAR
jgi:trehalose 6-phosphate phosphatase